MNATEYQNWLGKGFLLVESALAEEFASPFQRVITEEYVRIGFMRGLVAANPANAYRVKMEQPVHFGRAACISHGTRIRSQGRQLALDVFIDSDPSKANDNGLACEIKWLKNRNGHGIDYSDKIIQDLWKLALSRGVIREGAALRTYMLIGGDAKSFSITLKNLQKSGVGFRWSPAGNSTGWPKPQRVLFGKKFHLHVAALLALLKRGRHRRFPPSCWWEMRISLRERWFRTDAGASSWRIALWELDHRGVGIFDFDWPNTIQGFSIKC